MAQIATSVREKTRSPLVPVRFLQKYRPYNRGEIAGFPADSVILKALLEPRPGGAVAERYDPPKKSD